MLIVLAELKVSVSNCEKMSYKIASRLRFSRADGTYKDVGTLVITIFLYIIQPYSNQGYK